MIGASKCGDEIVSEPFEPIEIVGVDTPNVSTPRDDGIRGSGLCRVPIKLSRRPPREWAAAVPDIWNHPPEFTTMHRPGIASVRGDTLVLDGTTIAFPAPRPHDANAAIRLALAETRRSWERAYVGEPPTSGERAAAYVFGLYVERIDDAEPIGDLVASRRGAANYRTHLMAISSDPEAQAATAAMT
jgi:hypothetical protein